MYTLYNNYKIILFENIVNYPSIKIFGSVAFVKVYRYFILYSTIVYVVIVIDYCNKSSYQVFLLDQLVIAMVCV